MKLDIDNPEAMFSSRAGRGSQSSRAVVVQQEDARQARPQPRQTIKINLQWNDIIYL